MSELLKQIACSSDGLFALTLIVGLVIYFLYRVIDRVLTFLEVRKHGYNPFEYEEDKNDE